MCYTNSDMSSEINFKIVFLVLLHLLIHVLIKCDRILIVEGFANFVERSTAGKRGDTMLWREDNFDFGQI